MKRFVSILLVLVFCLALLPGQAFAVTELKNLTITMDLPDPGKTPTATATCGKGYSIYAIDWLDRETNKFLEPGDKIQGGRKYYAYLWVEANSGYRFASINDNTPDVNVTINGAACTASKAYEYIAPAMVYVAYPVTIPTKGWIRSVDLTVPAPKVGEKPSYPKIQYTTYEYTNMVNLPEYQNGIHWVNMATGKNVSPSETFQAGVQYQVNIEIKPNTGYAFLPQPKAKINGQTASCDIDYGSVLFVKFTFPAFGDDHTHIYSDSDWNSGQHYKTCLVDGCSYDIFFVESHNGGIATCQQDGICTVCGYVYIKASEKYHIPDTSKWIAKGDGYHYHACKLCGAHCDTEDHRWSPTYLYKDKNGHAWICADCKATSTIEKHVAGPAGTPGAEVVCRDCGYIMEPAANHVHALTKVPQTPATCTEEGNIEYYTCSGCNDRFTDAQGANLIPETMSVGVGALGHTVSDTWGMDDTYHWRTCSVCQEILDETKMYHDPDKATCTTCSTTDSSEPTEATVPAETAPEEGKSEEENEGFAWWVWALVAVGCAGAGVATAILLVKKKKE